MLSSRYLRDPFHYARVAAKRMIYFARTGYVHTEERDNPDFGGVHFERHLRVYECITPLAAGQDVLDVGCGCGTGSHLLAQTARRVTAIDRSAMALRFARRRWHASRNLRFVQMDAESITLPARSMNLVVSNENIEHLADIEAHLASVSAVLDPDGGYFIGTPNPAATGGRNRFHHREYEPDAMVQLARKYFSDVEVVMPGRCVRLAGIALDGDLLTNQWSYFVFARRPRP